MPLSPDGSVHAAPSARQQGVSPFEVLRPLAAACGSLLVAAEFAAAPVTLGWTVVLAAIARMTRWPPRWLAIPALAGVAWAVAAGPGRAAGGFTAGGAHLAAFLASPGSISAHLARLPSAMGRWRAGLAGQLPLALVAAAAQVAIVGKLLGASRPAGRGENRNASEAEDGRERPYRAGPGSAVRRAYVTATLRRGEVATTDGACIGVDRGTSRRIALSWAEAARGVLVTGDDPPAVTRTGLDLAVAAIQHRKAVIVVDLAADPGLVAKAVAAACSVNRAPLRTVPRLAGKAEALGLDAVLAGREVVLAQPAFPAPADAAALARRAALGLIDALAGRRALGVPADGLAWFNGCEQCDDKTLDDLLALAGQAALPLVLGTACGPFAAGLAGQAGAVAVRGRPPLDWPESQPGYREPPSERARETPAGRRVDAPALPGGVLAGRRDDDLCLLVRGPRARLVTCCRAAST